METAIRIELRLSKQDSASQRRLTMPAGQATRRSQDRLRLGVSHGAEHQPLPDQCNGQCCAIATITRMLNLPI
jgi:hypothetical protein